jgi:hypothetical protein
LRLWVESGALPAETIQILHLVRDPEAIVRSSLEHPSVQKFCERDPVRARKMVLDYIALADWQVRTLGLPTLRLAYEDLVREPLEQTTRLASWLGVEDGERIHRASRAVGKRSAQRRYFWNRTLTFSFRAVRKVYRLCARDRVSS